MLSFIESYKFVADSLSQYDKQKGIFRRYLAGDSLAIRKLKSLPYAQHNFPTKIIECFIQYEKREGSATYRTYISMMRGLTQKTLTDEALSYLFNIFVLLNNHTLLDNENLELLLLSIFFWYKYSDDKRNTDMIAELLACMEVFKKHHCLNQETYEISLNIASIYINDSDIAAEGEGEPISCQCKLSEFINELLKTGLEINHITMMIYEAINQRDLIFLLISFLKDKIKLDQYIKVMYKLNQYEVLNFNNFNNLVRYAHDLSSLINCMIYISEAGIPISTENFCKLLTYPNLQLLSPAILHFRVMTPTQSSKLIQNSLFYLMESEGDPKILSETITSIAKYNETLINEKNLKQLTQMNCLGSLKWQPTFLRHLAMMAIFGITGLTDLIAEKHRQMLKNGSTRKECELATPTQLSQFHNVIYQLEKNFPLISLTEEIYSLITNCENLTSAGSILAVLSHYKLTALLTPHWLKQIIIKSYTDLKVLRMLIHELAKREMLETDLFNSFETIVQHKDPMSLMIAIYELKLIKLLNLETFKFIAVIPQDDLLWFLLLIAQFREANILNQAVLNKLIHLFCYGFINIFYYTNYFHESGDLTSKVLDDIFSLVKPNDEVVVANKCEKTDQQHNLSFFFKSPQLLLSLQDEQPVLTRPTHALSCSK